ncbi:Signal transduction histidine-protein kinase ArlS [Streptococcus gordonii]|uniref:histidine kinase n=1 Tax=Streptococcus gordonii (strain Challis / ATCC 35105 / BCRC 15272 / CH1 / DL1 / V288) TaxID=467705 RepID=A8AX52_STRGC|nr:HAMP domain-containing sensor histidine kinase [Streptococcus gordonii]ABV10741.1 Sensor protein CiaH [Streptococcus gordonii str. Challis substr. CH1]MBZ2138171.1 HAMP domain-containing histidine kinase [Streptococcus gordonii]MCY7139804.1 HAMP domain-containing histidine kinase [Streptococcus gordonii]QGS43437.1 sensor histidine kinase [Streptococcus gordonii]RSJ55107.1 Signal transduction histidine-protein kinase ArlS [Streptococcus gordonii]
MLNKLRRTLYADDFSYFIRYFGVFTLIFSAMTLLIIQIMRSGLYTTVDDNLKSLSQNPRSVLHLALARAANMQPTIDEGQPSDDESGPQNAPDPGPMDNLKVNSNTEAVLFDEGLKPLTTADHFLSLKTISIKKKDVGKIIQINLKNNYGQEELYRMLVFEINPSEFLSGNLLNKVKYAAVLINVNQLEQTSQNHEQIIVIVMISFWLISIIASIYLARVSVKPLIDSMQKQKSFVENASHELRTPLAVLQNRLETLFRKPEATIMESSENIASSLEEVRNMRMLTTNLLNLARRDDGIKPEIADVEPEFFTTTFANYEIIADENEKAFVYENHINHNIKTDRTLLKQLMTILFDNAVKYTEEDGVIKFIVWSKDRSLYLRVSDNGPGINNEDKKKIFDRFYRVDKARTRQKGGFGLGLSLAKQIADALKGTITVKDNRPKGTIFEVKISIKSESKKKSTKLIGNK